MILNVKIVPLAGDIDMNDLFRHKIFQTKSNLVRNHKMKCTATGQSSWRRQEGRTWRGEAAETLIHFLAAETYIVEATKP